MKIYVILRYDCEFCGIHSAVSSIEEAKQLVDKLNSEEEEKNRLYCEWVDSEGIEEEMPNEFGDYHFTFRETVLN